MPVSDQAILDYIGANPGPGRENIRKAVAPREHRTDYVGAQFKGLHEGNVIRFKLKPEDLADIPQG